MAGPSAVVLSDCVDAVLLSWAPSFVAGQALVAKLGLAAGSLAYLVRCYAADAAHESLRRMRPPHGAVPTLHGGGVAGAGAGAGGAAAAADAKAAGLVARVAGLKLRARAVLG